MLKLLLKKQLSEIFRSYFYNAKTGQTKPKKKIITSFVLFGCLMAFLFGGAFFSLGMGLGINTCGTPYSWFYFLIFEIIAIVVGVFGSVFTTFSGLYLSKDNDLLLSMPIPVWKIILSRIAGVYLMGLLYSAFVYIPGLLVNFIYGGWDASVFLSGIMMLISISLIILILSCLLGYLVARISLVLTNKSIGKVLIGLLLLGAYYVVYFKLIGGMTDVMENPAVYGESLKGKAYIIYKFGAAGAGDLLTGAVLLLCLAVMTLVVGYIISHSFIKTATSSGKGEKASKKTLEYGKNSVSKAIFRKELSRFTSSAAYMMNTGMGLVFLPIVGVALIWKSGSIAALSLLIGDYLIVGAATVLVMMCSMNDLSAPSVSLEGKNIWIYHSLPVDPAEILKGKLKLHITVCMPSVIFASVCVAAVLSSNIAEGIALVVLPVVYTVFSGEAGLILGLKFPNLSWTNEMVPIKQSAPVTAALFGGWGFAVVMGGIYVLLTVIGIAVNQVLYLGIFILLTAAASVYMYRWLKGRGAEIFSKL